jgi:hypothetical protein
LPQHFKPGERLVCARNAWIQQWHHPMNTRARYNLQHILEIELSKWFFAKLIKLLNLICCFISKSQVEIFK